MQILRIPAQATITLVPAWRPKFRRFCKICKWNFYLDYQDPSKAKNGSFIKK